LLPEAAQAVEDQEEHMGRRHSSSRRRSYGRRQHEVRERREGPLTGLELDGGSQRDNWRMIDLDDDVQRQGFGDSIGQSQP
jgi:hypothetical protein